jgi:hypothetical protein
MFVSVHAAAFAQNAPTSQPLPLATKDAAAKAPESVEPPPTLNCRRQCFWVDVSLWVRRRHAQFMARLLYPRWRTLKGASVRAKTDLTDVVAFYLRFLYCFSM